MESITTNSGFKHITEKVFQLLPNEDLRVCREVNQAWKMTLDCPLFWLFKKLKIHQSSCNSCAAGPCNCEQKKISWKILIKELNDRIKKKKTDNLKQDFVVVLIKMQKGILKFPLEMVLDLGTSNHYPNVIKFILQNSDTKSYVTALDDFMSKILMDEG